MTKREMAVAERTELVELLESLDEQQWAAPSLCPGWTVRDVAVHVVSYDDLGWSLALAKAFAAGRLDVDTINEHRLHAYDDVSAQDVPDLVRRRVAPRGLTSGFGGSIALTDGLIHQQDIRRPLGLPRTLPEDRLLHALRFAYTAPTVKGFWNLRGVRLRADDVEWAAGRGDDVHGPGEAALMAMAGRRDALADLSGPGLDRLARNLR